MYSSASFADRINLIYGNNAQGKTNLLEAIYFASMLRSFRNVSDRDLIHFDKEKASISIKYEIEGREMEEEILLEKGKEKKVWINGVRLLKYKEARDYLKVVFFYPEELEIVKGSPEKRRDFLDEMIGVLKPKYKKALFNYNIALKQKNNLLKNLHRGGSGEEMLPVWEERLAEYGAIIMLYRKSFIEKYRSKVKDVHLEITDGKEMLDIYYDASVHIENEETKEEIKEVFFKKQESLKIPEKEKESSLVGPHRDDMIMEINGKNIRKFGSQGQQRSAVLSMKIAQMEMIREVFGEYPVLLLDDIMSELDEKRRAYFKEKIKGKQVFLTCTDKDDFKDSENKRSFLIQGGTIQCTSILEETE